LFKILNKPAKIINLLFLDMKMVIDIIANYLKDMPLTVLIPYTLSFLALLIGSFTDLRTREVPDWVNLGLVGAGFGVNLIFSVIYWKIDFILASVIGFGVFFAIAWVMFYAGQWGGGDSKVLMGLGAMLGIDVLSKNFFLVQFLVNVVVIGALYGILWFLFLVFKNGKKFSASFRKNLKNKKIENTKKVIIVIFLILLAAGFVVQDTFLRLAFFYLAMVLIVTFYIWVMAKSVQESCMLKYVIPKQLTEGDWIAKDIKINNKYITGPKDLGVTKRQISKLIAFYNKGKIRKVQIKEGIPFVPSFFIAFVATLIYGNLLLLLI
jgi:prepilin signal peptidase PulO-like enzyme (type II secretory pathway)